MTVKKFVADLWALATENRLRAIISALLLADAIFLLAGLLQPDWGVSFRLLKVKTSKYEMDVFGSIHVIAWTIGPPAWFFIEAFVCMKPYLPNPDGSTTPEISKARLERWKIQVDMAKAFWAAVLAAILFSVPKT